MARPLSQLARSLQLPDDGQPSNSSKRKKTNCEQGPKLKSEHYAMILDFIEIPANLQAITGSGRKTTIGGKYQTKKSAFSGMLGVLMEHGFPTMDSGHLMKRFHRYLDMYKKARLIKTDTGGGLTEQEFREGITIEEKLEKVCAHFQRMHAIFGAKANVNPPHTKEVGFIDTNCNGGEDEEDSMDESQMNSVGEGSTIPSAIEVDESDDDLDYPHLEASLREAGFDLVYPPQTNGNSEPAKMQQQQQQTQCPQEPPQHAQQRRQTQLPQEPPHRAQQSQTQRPQDPPKHAQQQSETVRQPLKPLSVQPPKSGEGNKGVTKKKGETTPKNALATAYMERCNLKQEFRSTLVTSKAKWKSEELLEKRLAREQAAQLEELTREHQVEMAERAEKQAAKKARKEQKHSLAMAKLNHKTTVMIELLRSGNNVEEITRFKPILIDDTESE